MDTLSVVSSRLTRQLTGWTEWFSQLRAICAHANSRRARLLLVPGTTPYRFVRRASELFGCQVTTVDSHIGLPDVPADIPARDFCAAAMADELFVLYVRRGGHIHQLLRGQLALPMHQRPRINLVMPTKTADDVCDQLLAAGAVVWLAGMGEAGGADRSTRGPGRSSNVTRPTSRPDVCRDPLVHCTRAAQGPWPGEPETAYLDALLLGTAYQREGPLASLVRIVTTRRLHGSAHGIRGGHSVISFADVPLKQIGQLRRFRPHRGRWDFEPFGIAIARSWLQARGARPVVYGDESDWQRMDGPLRPFFQRSGSSSGRLDWTVEREWRHLGDIDLTQLPPELGFIFVPTEAAAAQLDRLSPWPVQVLEG